MSERECDTHAAHEYVATYLVNISGILVSAVHTYVCQVKCTVVTNQVVKTTYIATHSYVAM